MQDKVLVTANPFRTCTVGGDGDDPENTHIVRESGAARCDDLVRLVEPGPALVAAPEGIVETPDGPASHRGPVTPTDTDRGAPVVDEAIAGRLEYPRDRME